MKGNSNKEELSVWAPHVVRMGWDGSVKKMKCSDGMGWYCDEVANN